MAARFGNGEERNVQHQVLPPLMAVGDNIGNEGVRFSRLDLLILLASGEAELLVGCTAHASPEFAVAGEDEEDASCENFARHDGLWAIAVYGRAAVKEIGSDFVGVQDDDRGPGHVEGEDRAICACPFGVLEPCLALDVPYVPEDGNTWWAGRKLAAGEDAAHDNVKDINDGETC